MEELLTTPHAPLLENPNHAREHVIERMLADLRAIGPVPEPLLLLLARAVLENKRVLEQVVLVCT